MTKEFAWGLLVVAGLLEVGWAVGLKLSAGFTRPVPTLLTLVSMATSLYFLGKSATVLPIGSAYAIWVGIGSVGAAVLGMIVFKEPVTSARIIFLCMLVVSLIGLKMTS